MAPRADALDLIPRLRHDAGRLQQHAAIPKFRVDLDGEFRLDPKPLGGIAVALLDAALGVEAVTAHVPLALRTSRTRHRIGPPHDPRHQIARLQLRAAGCIEDTAKRLVADDQALLSCWGAPIFAGRDLAVRAANLDSQRLAQD